ncbi:hypothetical protein GNI_004080 [Gregarina niphandrodes]|uniref:Late embryogenesis abundant protein n=1 Tax=Gregarina niphandrodes TaxID=110365 RepID=A0A023BDP9_GRENI|nr:hypothetical protein GNI_004080 [Gregarina niphandrodes]EZG88612.1 hypothetical protein GNI_004080 [Gregarina niphandrodes]|eukprot:XP_011128547.1 hypothetical protein GNI_004080 [Gregarina niphandrodes]
MKDGIASGAKAAVDAVAEKAVDVKDSLASQAKTSWDTAAHKAEDAKDNIASQAKTTMDTAAQKAEDVKDTVQLKAKDAVEAGAGAFRGMKMSYKDAAQGAIDSAHAAEQKAAVHAAAKPSAEVPCTTITRAVSIEELINKDKKVAPAPHAKQDAFRAAIRSAKESQCTKLATTTRAKPASETVCKSCPTQSQDCTGPNCPAQEQVALPQPDQRNDEKAPQQAAAKPARQNEAKEDNKCEAKASDQCQDKNQCEQGSCEPNRKDTCAAVQEAQCAIEKAQSSLNKVKCDRQ